MTSLINTAPTIVAPLVYPAAPSSKDSRWLTLDVCREFTRNKCARSEEECRFAHPPANVEVQNGRVMCCFDSIKGKCQRREPPCKYLHPPQHLKEQLLQNGRNNLILKHLHMQMIAHSLPSIYPIVYDVGGKSLVAAAGSVPAGYLPVHLHHPTQDSVGGASSYVTGPRYILPPTTTACYSPTYYTASPAPFSPLAASSPLYQAPSAPTHTAPHNNCDTSGGQQQQQLVLVTSCANNQHLVDNNESCQQAAGMPSWSCNTSSCQSTVDSTNNNNNYNNNNTQFYFQPASGMLMKSGAESKCGAAMSSFYQPFPAGYQHTVTLAAMQLQQPTYVPFNAMPSSPGNEPRY